MLNKRTFVLGFFLLLVFNHAHALKPIPIQAGLLKLSSFRSQRNSKIEFTALRRIFDIQGIPYDVLEHPAQMVEYKTVFTAGSLLDKDTTPEVLNRLYDYVEGGGTLFSAGQIGKRLYPLFGVTHHAPSKHRYRLKFNGSNEALKYINRPEEQTISLGNGNKHFFDQVIWTHGYRGAGGTQQLGTFEDGQGAFFHSQYGRGKTYLLGISYIDSVMRPQIGKDYEAQRSYVNAFEPSADVIMLIVKAVYETYTSPYVILSVIPYARRTALILSHDVDAQTSFVDSIKFANLEARFGVTSTFFETTKTFVDAMDIDYYNIEENRTAIRTLKQRGWDIGSHSVSHAKDFGTLPVGDPGISIAEYQPKIHKTIYGEVLISKQLLDRDISGQNTVSFRAGDLAFPTQLIGILQNSGYLYDSTFSANDVLSAFPFFAFKDRIIGSEESKIIEIPVTLDDSLSFLTPKTINKVVKIWKEVVTANMENGGITVLLIHPSDTRNQDYKLKAQEELMQFVQRRNGWMGNIREFGDFFRHRQQVKIKVFQKSNKGIIIQINPKNTHPMVGFILGNTSLDISQISIQKNDRNPIQYKILKTGDVFKISSNP